MMKSNKTIFNLNMYDIPRLHFFSYQICAAMVRLEAGSVSRIGVKFLSLSHCPGLAYLYKDSIHQAWKTWILVMKYK